MDINNLTLASEQIHPIGLIERNLHHSTFHKVIPKGSANVHVYFDKDCIFLITLDEFNQEIDFEQRERKITLSSLTGAH